MNPSNNFLRLFLYIIFQIFVLNNINLMGFACPMLYIMFFITFAKGKSSIALMLYALCSGFVLDTFSDTGGIYALSTLVVAYISPSIARFVFGNNIDQSKGLKLKNFSPYQVSVFLTLSILLHHSVFYFAETFSLSLFFLALHRIVINTILTFVFCFLAYFLDR